MANRKRTTRKGTKGARAPHRNQKTKHKSHRRTNEESQPKDYLLEPHPELGIPDGAVLENPEV